MVGGERPPAGGRFVWSAGGAPSDRDRLPWADRGRELNRLEAARLLSLPTVEVAVAGEGGTRRWLDGGERRRVWRDEIEPNFHDQPGWRPPPSAPRRRP
ncbi:MAG TPA: hypothetical protein VHN98_03340, partial [Acidimicrobiales bacterium]|nr:hypothetical protein [Acidimicrobiales bacterium]